MQDRRLLRPSPANKPPRIALVKYQFCPGSVQMKFIVNQYIGASNLAGPFRYGESRAPLTMAAVRYATIAGWKSVRSPTFAVVLRRDFGRPNPPGPRLDPERWPVTSQVCLLKRFFTSVHNQLLHKHFEALFPLSATTTSCKHKQTK